MEPTEEKAKKSITASWAEGIPAAVMLGIMDNYLIPYALYLGAQTREIGIVIAIPYLAGSLIQLYASDIVRYTGSRRRFLLTATLAQAFLLIPLALLVFTGASWKMIIFTLLVAAYRMTGNLIGTAWGSLVSDYFPPEKRGDYFGWRAQVTGIAGLLGIAVAGIFLYQMKKVNPAVGFSFLFLLAAFFRFVSNFMLRRLVDVPIHNERSHDFTFWMFLRRFRESNFVRFVFYAAAITFGTHLAAPYFSVYMLRDLHFSYIAYASVQFASVLAGLLSFPVWGKHADLVGNVKILKITSLLIPTLPLLWLFTQNFWLLILIEAFSGFVWSGFNLCASNFIYDAVSPGKRIRCLGYFNLFIGGAFFAGSSLGGLLADIMPKMFGYRMLSLFLCSALIRGAAHFILSPGFKEVREAPHSAVPRRKLLLSVLGVSPLASKVELETFPRFQWQRHFDSAWLNLKLKNL